MKSDGEGEAWYLSSIFANSLNIRRKFPMYLPSIEERQTKHTHEYNTQMSCKLKPIKLPSQVCTEYFQLSTELCYSSCGPAFVRLRIVHIKCALPLLGNGNEIFLCKYVWVHFWWHYLLEFIYFFRPGKRRDLIGLHSVWLHLYYICASLSITWFIVWPHVYS